MSHPNPPTDESMPAPGNLAMGQMGMWLFLGTEVMFFAALLATFLILRNSVAGADGAGWPNAAQVHLNPWIGLFNTSLLLLSSVLVSLAVQNLAAGNSQHATRSLFAAIALGVCFLGVKGYEYYGKFHHQLLPGRIGEVFAEGSTIARRYDEGPGLGWLDLLKPQLEQLAGKEYKLLTAKEKPATPEASAQLLDSITSDPGKNLAYGIFTALDIGTGSASMAARMVFQTNESIRSSNQTAKAENRPLQAELPIQPALPHGNLWASCYFFITGLHGIHLVAGLMALAIPAFAGLIGRLGPSQYGYLANTALYWHFVDLVWIIIFPLLYLV